MQKINHSLAKSFDQVTYLVDQNQEKIAQFISIGQIAIELKDKWQEIKARRNREKSKHEHVGGNLDG